MDYVSGEAPSRRRSVRRAVEVEAQVTSDLWDVAVPFLATNLSADGMWLETELSLEQGEQLIVSLMPPHWTGQEPLTALAQVARVGMFRRQRERTAHNSGMGLQFLEVEGDGAQRLRDALRGLPPPLPKRSVGCTPAVIARAVVANIDQARVVAPHPTIQVVGHGPQITLDDGSVHCWRAESELLTGGRATLSAAHFLSHGPLLQQHVSSPMSAILGCGHSAKHTHALRMAS